MGKVASNHLHQRASKSCGSSSLLYVEVCQVFTSPAVAVGRNVRIMLCLFIVYLAYRLLYTGKTKVTERNIFELLYAGKIFELQDLQIQCTELLQKRMSSNSICKFTAESFNFDTKAFTDVCSNYIKDEYFGNTESG